MKKHVVIVGAGFAGLELAARLSESLADAVHVTLIDRNHSFHFGGFRSCPCCSVDKLRPMCCCTTATSARTRLSSAGRQCGRSTRGRRHVLTDEGSYEADFLTVALGADYDFAATPGFQEGGFEYYSLTGAERLRDALADFSAERI